MSGDIAISPAVTPVASAAPRAGTRAPSIDLARGLIVALMALDHVRMYFTEAQFDPVDLDSTTLGYFLTRWITHLCAPGFFVIAGLSAALYETRTSRAEAARFLLTRGAWLVALEFTLFGVAWSFNPGWFWFGVIWGLGASMIALGLLLRIGKPLLFAGGALFTLLHNAFAADLSGVGAATLLYSGGEVDLPWLGPRVVVYPLLPWFAVMVIGYASAPWLVPDGRLRSDRAIRAGVGLIALFIIARLMGIGAPEGSGFDAAGDASRTAMAFLNVEKYPPSLQFSAVTVGLILLLTGVAERRPRLAQSVALRPALIFGQVPFFFYLVHLFAIHGTAFAVAAMAGWPTRFLFWTGTGPNLQPPNGYGLSLAGVYLAWLLLLAGLLPICARFASLKRERASWWLKYL